MKKISMGESIIVSITIGSLGFDDMFKENAIFNKKDIEVIQFEEISKEYLLVEIMFKEK